MTDRRPRARVLLAEAAALGVTIADLVALTDTIVGSFHRRLPARVTDNPACPGADGDQ